MHKQKTWQSYKGYFCQSVKGCCIHVTWPLLCEQRCLLKEFEKPWEMTFSNINLGRNQKYLGLSIILVLNIFCCVYNFSSPYLAADKTDCLTGISSRDYSAIHFTLINVGLILQETYCIHTWLQRIRPSSKLNPTF